jgi:hypothetical protein
VNEGRARSERRASEEREHGRARGERGANEGRVRGEQRVGEPGREDEE